MSTEQEFEAGLISTILREEGQPMKILSLALKYKRQRHGNGNLKTDKPYREDCEAFLVANADAAGWERVGAKGWTLKGNPAPKQGHMTGEGFQHDTNDACEEIAQELASAIIAKDKAQAIISEKRGELKDAMKGEQLKKYTSFGEDGAKRTWTLSTQERLTLAKPEKDE